MNLDDDSSWMAVGYAEASQAVLTLAMITFAVLIFVFMFAGALWHRMTHHY